MPTSADTLPSHQDDEAGHVAWRRREIEIDPHDAVDAEIVERRRQQRRDIGRGDGMRERQPAIDRNEPRLDGEAEEGQQEHGPAQSHGRSPRSAAWMAAKSRLPRGIGKQG